jgi:hypothetical protein
MATRRAIANGNWSATSTWNGGVLPGNGDTVFANGFNVTLDVDVNIGGVNNPIVNTGSLVSGQWYEIVNVGGQNWTTLGAASNTVGTVFQSTGTGTAGNLGTARALATLATATNAAAGATTGGGGFAMSTARAITTDLRAGTTICLDVTATSGTLVLDNVRILGGSAANAFGLRTTTVFQITSGAFSGSAAAGLNNLATGQSTLTNCILTGAGGGATIAAVFNSSSGAVDINLSSFIGGGSSAGPAFSNVSTGLITISSSTFTGQTSAAISNLSTGSLIINSSTFTGSSTGGNGLALNNASTGTVIVTQSTFTASAFTNAVSSASTTADVRLSGDFLDHWSGFKAVSSPRFRLGTAPTLGQTRYALAGTTDSYFTMYGADNGSFGNPIAADVRSGTVYASGNLTGTCEVPSAGSVAFGVPVDATTGTAVLTAAAIRAELAVELARIDATVSSAGNAPTAVQIRTEMDSNSTKLANLDATVSSRLAPSGTLATVTTLTNAPTVPTAAAIADEVRVELATELGRIDAPVSGAPTAAANASAVRTELATELARVDAAVSTRLASSAYTAPSNSDVTAIKAKTDLLETTRLAQCSTVATTGAQLAAALS